MKFILWVVRVVCMGEMMNVFFILILLGQAVAQLVEAVR
jgi:hypothetical protein